MNAAYGLTPEEMPHVGNGPASHAGCGTSRIPAVMPSSLIASDQTLFAFAPAGTGVLTKLPLHF